MRTGSIAAWIAVAAALAPSCGRAPGDAPAAPTAAGPSSCVGRAACAECHKKEMDLFTGSDHDRAMEVPDATTVAGNFDGATFPYAGTTSVFSKRDARFVARTDGPDGGLRDYPVAYTFGVRPLQQYLIEFPRGRFQAISICWDARSKEVGGQRWFHLHPDEGVDSRNVLHWTGPAQNWNYMCAECHSTNLRKNYVAAEDRYETTWSEIDVSCEACHGPGSRHVTWARDAARGKVSRDPDLGLDVRLGDPAKGIWEYVSGNPIARLNRPRTSRAEVETCGRCHSRRGQVAADYRFGRPLADTHRVALLDEGLYQADGQIQDEVYEYGSFLQSKMYGKGVTCSDCHEPHAAKFHFRGNEICGRCHRPEVFDTPAHHHHEAGGDGARCVECHMAARWYMVVDKRRDHSFRVPRPDLTLKIGTPNACNDCHTDKTARWAADAARAWYGPKRSNALHWGEAIHAGRRGLPRAAEALSRVAVDPEVPAIARATAVTLLERYPEPGTAAVLEKAASDPDPLVRRATAEALDSFPSQERLKIGAPLLRDPVRTVRLEIAATLAGTPPGSLAPSDRDVLEKGIVEHRWSLEFNADRADSRVSLGNLEAGLGRAAEAEAAYRAAIRLEPSFLPGYVNLADLYREQGRDTEGEAVLREALAREPDNAEVHHALGLLLVRTKRMPEALDHLSRAAALRADDVRYAYVLGVALHGAGNTRRALDVLAAAERRSPGDRDLLVALATINRDAGNRRAAAAWARKLVDLVPGDAEARALLSDLE